MKTFILLILLSSCRTSKPGYSKVRVIDVVDNQTLVKDLSDEWSREKWIDTAVYGTGKKWINNKYFK